MEPTPIFNNLFLSVGSMKAGTTWLYSVLSRNPELHFTPEKEIHYFHHQYVDHAILGEKLRLKNAKERYIFRFDPDKANIERVRLNLHWVSAYLSQPVDDHWYRNLFQMRQHETWACDFSNLNALLPAKAWPQIAQKSRQLRVLYTMRDPIKRLWSHTKFHLQIIKKLDLLETWKPEDYRKFAKQEFMWKNAEYGTVLKHLRDGLPQDHWKAIFYEDLHADQRRSLREIETFLGVRHFDYPANVLEQRMTESAKLPMPDFFPDLFAKDIARIKTEITDQGFTIPESWT